MRPVNENLEISRLLLRYMNGKLNKKEKEKIEDLLKKDEGLNKLYSDIRKPEYLELQLRRHRNLNIEERWRQHLRKIRREFFRKNLRYISRIAAIFLFPIFIAAYLYFNIDRNEADTQKQEFIAKVVPGSTKAQLIIDNGKVYELDRDIDLRIEDSLVRIENNEGVLHYSETRKKIEPEEVRFHTLLVPRGGEYFLTLADGSKLWVNSQTKLRYPEQFTGRDREIELMGGEVYLEVAHDPAHPFVVTTQKGIVKVLGTSFNVRAYNDEVGDYTTLVEGKVSLRHKYDEGSLLTLSPGQQGVIVDVNHRIRVNEVDVESVIAWKDGNYIFSSTSVEDIFNQLSRWYNFNVVYENEQVKGMRFRGNVDRYAGITQILDLLEKTNRIRFEYADETIKVKEN